MNLALKSGIFLRKAAKSSAMAGIFAASLAAGPAAAQMPSMLTAPGLSPAAPDTAAPTVTAPPELSAPPAGAASASGCETDMVKHQQRRTAAIEQINRMAGKNKKLDPVAACPKFRSLAAVEGAMKAWMIKNKEWCAIPDEVIENMKTGFARTPQIANQACSAAAQVQRMKAQGGQQQVRAGAAQAPAVKLPSGPL